MLFYISMYDINKVYCIIPDIPTSMEYINIYQINDLVQF